MRLTRAVQKKSAIHGRTLIILLVGGGSKEKMEMRKPEDIEIGNRTLAEVIENHKHWWNKDCKGWRNMRADLSRANLSEADLRGTNLRRADLRGANLRGANLSEADLIEADLSRADLRGADLRGAYLSRANLIEADLSVADLSEAYLIKADLSRAKLSEAYLVETNLSGADLSVAKNVPYIPYACPDFGMFIGFKKASGYIVVLEIPEDAKRLSATGRKCRCNKAKVIEIQNIDGTKANVTKVKSNYDSGFVYEVGKTIRVDNFCENRWEECSSGIHFFINRQEAVNY